MKVTALLVIGSILLLDGPLHFGQLLLAKARFFTIDRILHGRPENPNILDRAEPSGVNDDGTTRYPDAYAAWRNNLLSEFLDL
jgi:hypothetical protein